MVLVTLEDTGVDMVASRREDRAVTLMVVKILIEERIDILVDDTRGDIRLDHNLLKILNYFLIISTENPLTISDDEFLAEKKKYDEKRFFIKLFSN